MSAIRDFCTDFVLPFAILVGLFILLATGVDGEVKTLMAAMVGWITHSGVTRGRGAPKK